MLIKEYHILLPMSLDEYQVAQLYMIQVRAARRGHPGKGWSPANPASPATGLRPAGSPEEAREAPFGCGDGEGLWGEGQESRVVLLTR